MNEHRNYLREMAEGGYRSDAIGPFHRFMLPWLMRRHGVPVSGRVVDIGAGQGHTLIPLHDAGWRDLVAVDIDDYAFSTLATQYGIRTVRCDASCEPIALESASADAVSCFHLIEHLDDPANLLTEIRRILKPGAPGFIVTPDWRKAWRTFWDDPTHKHPYSKVAMGRLLRMHGFEVTQHSWNARFGLGRLQAYRLWPRLGMIGGEMLAVARRPGG